MNPNECSSEGNKTLLKTKDIDNGSGILTEKNHGYPFYRRSSNPVKQNSSPAFLSSLNKGFFEVVDPIDFEEQIVGQEVDPSLKVLHDFPPDDIEISVIPRQFRTVTPSLPEKIDDLNEQVQDCVKTYTKDWVVFTRRYQKTINASNQGKLKCLPYHVFKSDGETDFNQDRQQQWCSYELQTDLQRLYPGKCSVATLQETDLRNERARKTNRQQELFLLYQANEQEEIRRHHLIPDIPQEEFAHRFLINCLELKFEIEIEPLFASLALYDMREKKKISENFYVDLNSSEMRSCCQLEPSSEQANYITSAIFSVTNLSSDIYLVIKVEKILQQGSISESVEPYISFKEKETIKNKEKIDKLKLQAQSFCQYFGTYRMPVAWMSVNIMSILNGTQGLGDTENISTGYPAEEMMMKPTLPEDRQSSFGYRPLQHTVSTFYKQQIMMKAWPKVDIEQTNLNVFSISEVSEDMQIFLIRTSWLLSGYPAEEMMMKPSSPEDRQSSFGYRPLQHTVSTFYKQEEDKLSDEDIMKFITEEKKYSQILKKQRKISGSFKFEISPIKEGPSFCLTPEFLEVQTQSDLQGTALEILEFPVKEMYTPHMAYRNLLYVYPLSLNYRQGSSRNITVQIQVMRKEDQNDPLRIIFGKSGFPEYVSKIFTAVTYHNKFPHFYEEVKIRLPVNLSEENHLLFTFYNINCQLKANQGIPRREPVGYAWLRLVQDGYVQNGTFELPVALEKPTNSYLSNNSVSGIKWLENKKALFKVELRLMSSVHSQDRNVSDFLSNCQYLDRDLLLPQQLDIVKRCVSNLPNAKHEELVKFLHIILDKLLELLTKAMPGKADISSDIFATLVTIVDSLEKNEEMKKDLMGRNSLLASYVYYVFDTSGLPHKPGHAKQSFTSLSYGTQDDGVQSSPKHSVTEAEMDTTSLQPKKPFHEELACHIIRSFDASNSMVFEHAWFFFDLLVKSMSRYLSDTQQLNGPRNQRFTDFYNGLINTIISIAGSFVVSQQSSFSEKLNLQVAYFVSNLLSLMDRGYVLQLISSYYKLVNSKLAEQWLHLVEKRLDFLKIICSHEHFIILNLPFSTYLMDEQDTDSMKSFQDASMQEVFSEEYRASAGFRQHHFLVGLLFNELNSIFCVPSEGVIRKETVTMVQRILASHDSDPRYSEPEVKAIIASMYLLLLPLIMDKLPHLCNFTDSENLKSKCSAVTPDKEFPSYLTDLFPMTTRSLPSRTSLCSTSQKPAFMMSVEVSWTLLFCFLWVLKNADADVIAKWASQLNDSQLRTLLETLNLCLSCFEYEPQESASINKKSREVKSLIEETIFGTAGARSVMMKRHGYAGIDKLVPGGNPGRQEKLRWRKDQTRWRQQADKEKMVNKIKAEQDQDDLIKRNLATEVNLIVVDTLEIIVQRCLKEHNKNVIFDWVLSVLLHSLACNHTPSYLQHCLNTQRAFVAKYPELFFEDETERCKDLSVCLLQQCTSRLQSTSDQASASLYLLMRHSYKKHFPKVKLHITVALANIVANTSNSDEDESLLQTLHRLQNLSENDAEMKDTDFPLQVEVLVHNLKTVLVNTAKLQELHADPYMEIDVMYTIAKSYQTSVGLRLLWLEKMAERHKEYQNYSEAAQCLVHAAALVSEYLNMVEDHPYMPVGSISFQKISCNVLEESLVSDDVVTTEEAKINAESFISEEGLVRLLEQASELFIEAELYEVVNDVYKIIIPILEASRNIQKLSDIYGKLQSTLNVIISKEGKRIFGTFFRVGFYGPLFRDLNGQEFVYKEPGITRLAEMSYKLEEFYKNELGGNTVEVIKDSSPVDVKLLDPRKAYIQITYVEPCFDEYDLKHRISAFERNFNLRSFVYSTPFTRDGRPHGELHEQFKRKTILTTSSAFPYVKTRISVTRKEEMELTPIEAAIEDMQKKTQELASATQQEPPSPKILQMVLQGSVGTTVNQGPLEVAQVFLANIPEDPRLFKHHNKLRLCFKEFLRRSEEALAKNRTLIAPEQLDYHLELQRNFFQLQNACSRLSTGGFPRCMPALTVMALSSVDCPCAG
ncbi:dedicator of cytokinesis protein 7-like [Protopterus annectens]|uniref:dedicator of cytokinesis protein 7-like n=1 Tax=Protopterus annectens TaxID=7888 RepID=UPI001CF972F7|nr:dedicator of cytokinesis protein 7-like [Protopterus annectens]